MKELTFDQESGVVYLAPDSFLDHKFGATQKQLQNWLASRKVATTIDLSSVEYLDWIMFDQLLDIIRNHPFKIQIAGANPAVRSLFTLNHLELLLK